MTFLSFGMQLFRFFGRGNSLRCFHKWFMKRQTKTCLVYEQSFLFITNKSVLFMTSCGRCVILFKTRLLKTTIHTDTEGCLLTEVIILIGVCGRVELGGTLKLSLCSPFPVWLELREIWSKCPFVRFGSVEGGIIGCLAVNPSPENQIFSFALFLSLFYFYT
jgi:hypothetical protein